MIDDNIGLILRLFLNHLLRFCDLRPGNTVADVDVHLESKKQDTKLLAITSPTII